MEGSKEGWKAAFDTCQIIDFHMFDQHTAFMDTNQ